MNINKLNNYLIDFKMEGFCRGCLVKYNEPTDLLHYTEKNRRLFVYSTALQVKRNDVFTFQICKDCYLNMKLACRFKKQCRSADKKIKHYMSLQESGDESDFCNFLKNNEEMFPFRFPMALSNSTPAPHQDKDDDNDSTVTSIQNFMTDMMEDQEIPDTEARIICEVLEEEADVLEDSLDSHWLQDDVSIDTDFELNFSPFSTPRLTNSDRFSIHKLPSSEQESQPCNFYGSQSKEIILKTNQEYNNCVQIDNADRMSVVSVGSIEQRINEALQDESVNEVPLERLLASPKVQTRLGAPSTPTINNILFGELNLDESNSSIAKIGQEIENFTNVHGNMDVEEFFNKDMSLDKTDEIAKIKNKLIEDFMEQEGNSDLVHNSKGDESSKKGAVENKVTDTEEVIEIVEIVDDKDKEDIISSMDKRETKRYSFKNLTCYLCKKAFKLPFQLSCHLNKKHNIKLAKKITTEKIPSPRMCDICGEIFSTAILLRLHKKSKHKKPKKFSCPHCEYQFYSRATLQLHLSVVNKPLIKKKEYVCKICQLALYSMKDLEEHEKGHVIVFECDHCTQIFNNEYDLVIHKRVHKPPSFPCTQCDLVCKSHVELHKHIQTHEADNLYQCETCLKKFTQNIYLNRHLTRNRVCRLRKNSLDIRNTKNALGEFIAFT